MALSIEREPVAAKRLAEPGTLARERLPRLVLPPFVILDEAEAGRVTLLLAQRWKERRAPFVISGHGCLAPVSPVAVHVADHLRRQPRADEARFRRVADAKTRDGRDRLGEVEDADDLGQVVPDHADGAAAKPNLLG